MKKSILVASLSLMIALLVGGFGINLGSKRPLGLGNAKAVGPVPLFYTTLDNAASVSSPVNGIGTGAIINTTPSNDFVPGKVGNGIRIDAASEYVSVPETDGVTKNVNLTKGTLDFWYQPSYNNTDGLSHRIFGIGTRDSVGSIALYKRTSTYGNDLYLQVKDTASTLHITRVGASQYSWTAGQWVELRFTWDSTVGAGIQNAHIYINNSEKPYVQTNTGPFSMPAESSSANIWIGSLSATETAVASGVLDEFKIYGDVYVPDATPPSVPTNLGAAAASSSQINLSWAASTDNVGVAGYNVYRNGTQIATSPATSYSDLGLTASTTYTYTVSAFDAAGNVSSQSIAASATTQAAADTMPPSVPTGLSASPASSAQINLSWTASTDNVGVTGYIIYRNGVQVATSGTTSYSDTGLNASTTYSYTVAAFDASGNTSAQSAAAQATTQAPPDTTPPSVPTNLIATTASTSQINLSWNASTDNVGVTGYNIYRSGLLIATAASTSYSDTGLNPSTTYAYTVSAFDAAGNLSGQSTSASATTQTPPDTTPPSVPTNLLAAPFSTTEIDLSWNASTDNVGVTGYNIYRNGSLLTTVTATNYSDTGLTPSTTYSYAVSAFDAAGNTSALTLAIQAKTLDVADTTPPTVPANLSSPSSTMTSINLTWTASTDNVGVAGYHVYRNTTLIATVTATSYTDSGLAVDTAYTYTVDAFDAAGNTSVQSLSLQTNTQPDTAAPTATVSFPTANATVSGTITLSGTASDNVGVASVQYKIDGTNFGPTLFSTPYNLSLDTTTLTDGIHTVELDALDSAGNKGASAIVSFTVQNNQPATINPIYYSTLDNAAAVTTPVFGDGTGAVINTTPANDFVAGKIGNGIRINTSSEYVSIPEVNGSTKNVNLSRGSVEFWYQPSYNSTDGLNHRVFGVGLAANQGSLGLYKRTASYGNDLYFELIDSAKKAHWTTLNQYSWTAGQWVLIRITWDDTVATGVQNTRIYINNTEPPYTSTNTGPFTMPAESSANSIYIGTVGTGQTQVANGVIDEFKIYDVPLAPGGDTIAPSVPTGLSASPASIGQINLSWNPSSDNVAVTGYYVYRNGLRVASSAGTTYADTGLTAGTTYTYTVAAFDAAGNLSAQSLSVQATTPTVGSDTTPPTVSITTPLNNDTLSNTIKITANATDNVGVASVAFAVDGTSVGSPVTASPYQITYNASSLADGNHIISAVATDTSGNTQTTQINIKTSSTRPNIVVILTDDERYDMMQYMPLTQAAMGNETVQFSNGFVTTPDCCPSRSSILTGMYSHNTGILQDYPPNGGAPAFNPNSTIATWLKNSGYKTGIFGKYLNGYHALAPAVPPGWDEFHVFAGMNPSGSDDNLYYNYFFVDNGVQTSYGSTPADYSTTVLKNKAETFINNTPNSQPLFLYFTPFGPHDPALADPPDIGTNANVAPYRPASFGEPDVSDKPNWIKALPWGTTQISQVDTMREKMLDTMMSVDRATAELINTLKADGKWNNTMLIFMADNGTQWGEHRLVNSKFSVYEESVKVPFWVRTPGLTPRTDSNIVANIDLAPTIANWAGITPNATKVNGQSFTGLLNNPSTPWRSNLLLEYLGPTILSGQRFQAVRTQRYVYSELFTGERELYDLQNDPLEDNNVYTDPAYASVIPGLQAQLANLRSQ